MKLIYLDYKMIVHVNALHSINLKNTMWERDSFCLKIVTAEAPKLPDSQYLYLTAS